ncbi:hypothetical protein J7E38_22675 [Bacillus sp. ISL-35]|uniref:hypothetical protein n=1 Tax=Bacillus sp. ISL-35 TaxID=2819122 RepID=UPI001BE9C631|nr:hypothetical protein [Bacillus sp. ISL-35]MBT2681767.1 hypothetical protein [Bacillus sp. ISL-35]MBT2706064.1 hypothetical protein [Chryseobacterium sp. ISL-80]
MNLIKEIRMRKNLQNLILFMLFALIFTLPGNHIFGDIALMVIIFFIAYISSYINIVPFWKGLLYSFLVTLIIVAVFLATITLFPTISNLLLMAIIALTGFLCTYLIG